MQGYKVDCLRANLEQMCQPRSFSGRVLEVTVLKPSKLVSWQTLEDVEGRAGTFFDVLLHPGTGLIAFVGSFRGLQYAPPLEPSRTFSNFLEPSRILQKVLEAGCGIDVLLHPGMGLIAFAGSFLGLQYAPPLESSRTFPNLLELSRTF